MLYYLIVADVTSGTGKFDGKKGEILGYKIKRELEICISTGITPQSDTRNQELP